MTPSGMKCLEQVLDGAMHPVTHPCAVLCVPHSYVMWQNGTVSTFLPQRTIVDFIPAV